MTTNSETWKLDLWQLYNELDRTTNPEKRQRIKAAIAYSGGSLQCRHPIPKSIHVLPEDLPLKLRGE